MSAAVSRRAAWAAYFAASAWLLVFAGQGLNTWFSPDDAMNLQALHGLWDKPFAAIVRGFFNPLGGDYRPAGGIFYRALWALSGMNPLPFRAVCFALLLANLGLVCLLLRRHVRSWPALLAGLLVCAYHPEAGDLYFNTGTVYDLLAAFFYLLALLRAGDAPAWQTAALTWCAIQSKEMAATLPVVLALYLWLVENKRRYAPVIATAAVTALFLAVKLTGGQGLAGNELYRPRFEPLFVLQQYAKYHGDLVSAQRPASFGGMLTFWILLLTGFTSLRHRVLLFGFLFWLIALAPVAVIPARSGFVMYLPLVGLSLYSAVLLDAIPWKAVQWASLLLALIAGGAFYWDRRARTHEEFVQASRVSRQFCEQLKQLVPLRSAQARFVFLDDPFPARDWVLTFLVRLLYDDPGVLVERAKDGRPVLPAQGAYLLAFRKERLELESREQGPLARESLIIRPAKVRPGDPYTVRAATLRSTAVDVEYLMRSNGREVAGRAASWCQLDAGGLARIVTPLRQPPGSIRLVRIRAAGGPWFTADAALTVQP